MACRECFSGTVHAGTPVGTVEEIYGRKTYVTKPPDGKESKGVVVFIPDAFGLPFINNQVLCDRYAAKGQYIHYLPDVLRLLTDGGCLVSDNVMQDGERKFGFSYAPVLGVELGSVDLYARYNSVGVKTTQGGAIQTVSFSLGYRF